MTLRAANVGSGQRPFKSISGVIDWCNIDLVSRDGEEPDVVASMESLPFSNDTFDVIVYHQTLEHLELSAGARAIAEGYRVLKPGGSMLVFIPNIRALAVKWLTGGISDYIYGVNLTGAWRGRESDFHHWLHTEASLHDTMDSAGRWRDIKRFDWRVVPGAELANDFWVLAVEGVKA